MLGAMSSPVSISLEPELPDYVTWTIKFLDHPRRESEEIPVEVLNAWVWAYNNSKEGLLNIIQARYAEAGISEQELQLIALGREYANAREWLSSHTGNNSFWVKTKRWVPKENESV